MKIRYVTQQDISRIQKNGEFNKNKLVWQEGGYDIKYHRQGFTKFNKIDGYQYT